MNERKVVEDVKFETYMRKDNNENLKNEDLLANLDSAPLLYLDVNLGNG